MAKLIPAVIYIGGSAKEEQVLRIIQIAENLGMHFDTGYREYKVETVAHFKDLLNTQFNDDPILMYSPNGGENGRYKILENFLSKENIQFVVSNDYIMCDPSHLPPFNILD